MSAPKTAKETFVYQLSDEIIVDLGNFTETDWNKIKKDVQIIMKSKQTDTIGVAYIAAFIMYLYELEIMSDPYDPKKHWFN